MNIALQNALSSYHNVHLLIQGSASSQFILNNSGQHVISTGYECLSDWISELKQIKQLNQSRVFLLLLCVHKFTKERFRKDKL
jgi:hypothetical protein